jgi:hypothetical protein
MSKKTKNIDADLLIERLNNPDHITAVSKALRTLEHHELEVLDPLTDKNGVPLNADEIAARIRDGAHMSIGLYWDHVALVVVAEHDPGLWIVRDHTVQQARLHRKIYGVVIPAYRRQYGIAGQGYRCVELIRKDFPPSTQLLIALSFPEAMWCKQAELLADTLATHGRERERLVAMFTDARSGDLQVAIRLQALAGPSQVARLIAAMRQCDYGSLHGRDMLNWGSLSQAGLCAQLYQYAAKTSVAVVRLMETYPKTLGIWRFVGLDARWAEPVFALDV